MRPPAELTKDQELGAYRDMLLIRRFEEKAGQMYGMGLIGGFCHLYIGQEAVVVGMQMALKEGDGVITGYRDHGHMLACGMDPKGVMAELTGRSHGYSQAARAARCTCSPPRRASSAATASSAPRCRSAPASLSPTKYRGNDNVSLTYFGDGAANQGQVYESFNMAKLWNLPVIYVIENNHYAMGTSVKRASAHTDLCAARRAPTASPASRSTAWMCARSRPPPITPSQWCREGNGPIILEMLTYRYRGHSMSDPAKYRTREEVEKMRNEHDPIEQVRQRVLQKKWASEDDLKKIDAKVRETVNEAAEFATHDPEPDPSELYTDIYA